jgi:hypothetical protein
MVKKHESPSFELVLHVRDSQGNPTGKTKTAHTNDPQELENLILRTQGNVFGEEKLRQKNKKANKERNVVSSILFKLEKNTKLPKNWDGNNGRPLNYNTYRSISALLKKLADVIQNSPRIIALGNGGVKLEFVNKKTQKELDITFFDEFSVEYFYFDPKNNFQEEKTVGIEEELILRDVVSLYNRN